MAGNGISCHLSATWRGTWLVNKTLRNSTGGIQMDTGKSALGLDGNVAAALGYPISVIAIISLVMEKENRFVKFHAVQSLLLHAAVIIVGIGLAIIFMIIG